ncbi:MAG: 30S ribosomal protein S4 [Candidatus Gracilibacteria bacterium]|nr:30S ribosomal protein S4 [Candidatus Gracilibacteria bacterium]
MRYTGPKLKLCRREGINLFGTEKYDLSKVNRKKLGNSKVNNKLSEFGTQLREKQKVKRMYQLTERQFSSYYKKASRMSGVLGENMFRMLEMRFDNVIFKSNFARTIMQARQFANHAHFLVNGKKVNIPSYQLKIGDIIEIKEKMKESPFYKNLIEEFKEYESKNTNGMISSVKWIDVDAKSLKVAVKEAPTFADFDASMDIKKIVEFYSK